MIKKAVLAVLAVTLTGCFGTPPPKKDLYASIASAPPAGPYKDMSVGVVFSENSRQASAYVQEFVAGIKKQAGPFLKEDFDSERLIGGFPRLLNRNFKSAVQYPSVENAEAAGVDVIAVLDLHVEMPWGFQKAKCQASLAFLGPGKKELDIVRGESVRGIRSVPAGFLASGFTRVAKVSNVMMDECRERLEAALLSSGPLKTLAASAGRPFAPAPPAAGPGRPPLLMPTYSRPTSNDSVALVIGVEKYQSLPEADYADRDAEAVREHLVAAGFPAGNVVLLTGSQAGKAAVEKYVEHWLPRNVTERSSVFVYFSGHGAPDVKTGEAYLVPWDGDPRFLDATAYPLKRLYSKLNALKAKGVTVAMDACFSGTGGRSVLPKGLRPLVARTDTAESAAGRVTVLSAAGADEVTGAAEKHGHGLFTYHLLKALNAKGGASPLKALYADLEPAVREAARRENRDQTPRLLGDVDAVFP